MKKVVIVASMFIRAYAGFAQEESQVPGKTIFGFNLGINYSNIQSKAALSNNVKISNRAGFRMGILMDCPITKYLTFSPKAELSMNGGEILISNSNDKVAKYEVSPQCLEFTEHFVLKKGEGKSKPYFLVGPDFKFPITEKNQSTFNPDLAIDFGFGLEKKLTHFLFSPEIRYSLGLLNVNRDPLLKSLYIHNVSLVFNFKG